MLDSAVEVGIATYLAHPQTDDDEIRAFLERAGVEEWLAARLVAFLPVALGRVVLTGATMADTLNDGVERPLADEPVFGAAQERARRASRQEIEVIGLRSSEVHAVNAALQHGSRLEDLVLSPVTLVSPLPPCGSGHGGIPSPRQAFVESSRPTVTRSRPARARLHSGSLQLDARVFPRVKESAVSVQVDLAVRHPALAVTWLLESFGGMAATWSDALGQTIDKFQRASLHPLIAALLDCTSCVDQVSWERMEHPGGAFDACLGGQLVLYTPEPVPDLRPLLDSFTRALSDVPLSRAVHGLRLYVCWNGDQMLSNEVLLDNEPWEAGVALAAGHGWPGAGGLRATRLFWLLVPAPIA